MEGGTGGVKLGWSELEQVGPPSSNSCPSHTQLPAVGMGGSQAAGPLIGPTCGLVL